MKKFVSLFLLGTLCASALAADTSLFSRTNLVAWCIVPFDAKKRGPEERAAMMEKLGFKLFAYDYRAEHIPSFDAEMEALQRHNVKLLAWWFPGALNDEAKGILEVLKRHKAQAQLWITGGGEPTKDAAAQKARVEAEVQRIQPIAEAAAKINCTVGLYNHGGWFGEPENQVEIIKALRERGIKNVGIVYNQHHGHDQVDRFADLVAKMKPYLLCLNLNGMTRDGDKHGKKILPIGQGELDLPLLKVIAESGWRGPIGILNHTDEDAEGRLLDNLDGLKWLVEQLEGNPAGPRPQPRTWREPEKKTAAATDYWRVEDAVAREKLPLYQTIPAAQPHELTPANGLPVESTFRKWERSLGDNGSRRYSALKQITRENVKQLELAWTYHARDGTGNLQSNPAIVGDFMFVPTPGNHLVALDAATGLEKWRFKPDGRPAFRGLAYWPGKTDIPERLFFSAGKFLYAVSPKTGQPLADFGSHGRIPLPGQSSGHFGAAVVAPVVFGQTVITAGFEKDVWAFDAVTGQHRWTFHTVPREGEFGHDTWDFTPAYAANCWGGMSLDEQRGIVYIATGSPKDNFIGVNHRGRNLFANCVVALDARTGRRLWHFQEIAHDIWDLDIPAPPVLTTIQREGRAVDVVATVTKIGNTLLLDRVSGKPIFPFRLRRAPATDLPGELTWPYQPDPELPEPFSKLEFTATDLTDRSEEATESAAARFKSVSTGWFRPFSEGKMNLFFGIHGGAEWTGACADPTTGRLYVTANHIPWVVSVFRDDDPPDDPNAPKTRGHEVYDQRCATCHGANRIGLGTAPPLRGVRHRLGDREIRQLLATGRNSMPAQPDLSEPDLQALLDFLLVRDRPVVTAGKKADRPRYSYNGYPKFLDHEGYPASKPPWGTLNCLDLNTGRLLWKVPLGEHEELTAQGVPLTGTENFGGASMTAGGLVFVSGTRDSKIRAFNSETGQELWCAKLPFVGSAPPSIYEAQGRQFIVVPATGGGKLGTQPGDAYVAFSLPTKSAANLTAAATPVE